jgi:hypothetical protein
MTDAPKIIRDLVARFEENIDAYKGGHYNETQLRREFLDPFWKALGWDIDNEQGAAEAYKDVVHEDQIRIGGAVKAPDYCFRIGSERKFFLEAKKPSIFIKEEASPAYQIRRYAWSAKLPLSVLSDFEELAVYDCRIKPAQGDAASKARVFYCTFRDYLEKWGWISSVFSREAVYKGAFDRYTEENKAKRGTAEVDADFLTSIEGWREELAKNLALRNPGLSQRELNFAVQRTIDRIIFLRICEDRGIEDYSRLLAATSGEHVYKRLCENFRLADRRYNSGLFHFAKEAGRGDPDTLTLGLNIDDKLLKKLLTGLYYPDSPYEFSVLSADILGKVYEQFLGKTIRLTAGHRAVVEAKPEVRKAGGVYYTPVYIVDYIVRQTVGKLVEGKTPAELKKLRVLDPACGSGSFLINAYQFLLDWYLDWYLNDGAEKHSKKKASKLVQAKGGYKLTISERKRILLDHIFGVDIDYQAVEVTKLSLLLKVLEGETDQSIQTVFDFQRTRALPDLSDNIKCGNSLIGPDFYSGAQLDLLDEETERRINVFDWKAAFPSVFAGKDPGFDAVIGNPPYIRIQAMKEWAPVEVEHYKQRYRSASQGNYDIYVVFVEHGLGLINRGGSLGYILPNKFFNSKYGVGLRGVLTEGGHIEKIVNFGDQQVFEGVSNYTCLLFLGKKPAKRIDFSKVADLVSWRNGGKIESGKVKASSLSAAEWNFDIGSGAKLMEKLRAMPTKLGDVAHLFVGLQTSADAIYVLPLDCGLEKSATKPLLLTGDLRGYAPAIPAARLVFPFTLKDEKAHLIPAKAMEERFPKTWSYLRRHLDHLRGRDNGKLLSERWYDYVYRKNLAAFEAPKLIVQVTANKPTVLLDETGLYMTGGGSGPFYGVRPFDDRYSLRFLLGIMNSKLFGFVISKQSTPLRGGYYKYSKQYIESFALPSDDPRKGRTAPIHDRVVSLVERMLDLNARLPAARTADERERIERRIAATDQEIDRLVYELYGLTEEEIGVVEETTGGKP